MESYTKKSGGGGDYRIKGVGRREGRCRHVHSVIGAHADGEI